MEVVVAGGVDGHFIGQVVVRQRLNSLCGSCVMPDGMPMRKRVRRMLTIAIHLVALALMPVALASPVSAPIPSPAAGSNHKRILILYSFNNNVPTLQQTIAGIDGAIKRHSLRSADFVHEYLDIAPPKYPEQRATLRDLLLNKYAGQHFDLIVTYSSAATDFLLNEGKELSPDTPCIVFFGDNKPIGSSVRKVTNIQMPFDPRGTLERGLELFPSTQKVLFVVGNNEVDLQFEKQARTEFAAWHGKLEFEYSSSRSVADLMSDVAQLPPNTIIIFSNVASDIAGKRFVPRDLVKELAGKANAPVLSLFATQIDTGVVGGSMFDMEQVGAMIGEFMVAINSGRPLETSPPANYLKPMFNWTQIERWGANLHNLPADSLFVNRPQTLWRQYKVEVSSAIAVIILLSTMTVSLMLQNRQRKKAEMAARESAAQLDAERALLEQRVAERTAQLSEALEFSETMLLNSPVPMGIYAESGQCVMANEAYARFVGAPREVLLAQNFNAIPAWQKSSLFGDCLAALKLNAPQQREAHTVTSFGKDVWFEYQILPRHLKGQNHLLIQFFDLTERKHLEEELRHFAFHDSLTRLPNRRLLLDRLKQALRVGKRENSYLAVLFIDLDKFKLLNDSYGHDIGDQMLIEVASRLQGIVRDSDTVGRLGGDEFIVLLSDLGADPDRAAQYAESVIEKIRSSLSTDYIFDNIHHQGSASVGIKLILGGDLDPDQIIKEADAAMYENKNGSRVEFQQGKSDRHHNGSSASTFTTGNSPTV